MVKKYKVRVKSTAMYYTRGTSEKVLLQTSYLEVKYKAEGNMVLSNWSGWLNTEKGIAGCNSIVQAVIDEGATKLLNDNSQVTGSSGDTDFLSRVWIPSLRDAGLLYFAWVYSKEFFTQLQIDGAVDKSSGIAIKAFFSIDEARQWLNMY